MHNVTANAADAASPDSIVVIHFGFEKAENQPIKKRRRIARVIFFA
jgi:hypothetical protein